MNTRSANKPFGRILRWSLFSSLLVSLAFTQMYGSIVLVLWLVTVMGMYFTGYKIAASKVDLSLLFFATLLVTNSYGIVVGILTNVGPDVLLLNFKVYIIYPVIGLITAVVIKNFADIKLIEKLIFLSATCIILTNCYAMLQGVPSMPVGFPAFAERGMFSFSFYEGRFILNSLNIASIPVILPFLVYFSFFQMTYSGRRGLFSRVDFKFFILFLAMLAIITLSGRRGIWLSSAFSLWAILSIVFWMRSKRFFALQSIVLLAIGTWFFHYFDFLSYFNTEVDSQSERAIQSAHLLSGFMNRPLGNGIGSVFEVARHKDAWVFELTWHKLLADVGVVLLSSFVFLVFIFGHWFAVYGAKLPESLFLLAYVSMIALVGLLLASATNPYILNLDGFLAQGLLLGVIDGVKPRVQDPVEHTEPLFQRSG